MAKNIYHVMKNKITSLLFAASILCASSKTIYVSPYGDDNADGSFGQPFASLASAQKIVMPGDTVFFRGGVFKPTAQESMGERIDIYSCAYILDKNGTEDNRICYYAYPGEQPVFDMSAYRPEGKRVSAFYVSGSWLHIKGLEVIGTQVMISNGTNTQSECFSNRGGDHNIYENLKMHDGAGIGWYLVKGAYNLVLNCDAWCNHDPANGGGNVDGFGCHPRKGDKGNVLRGCRSWWNSDDGFDLIHSSEAVEIDSCWAFYNGYVPGSFESAADGNGIKAGGYGMKPNSRIAEVIPVHKVTNCLAYGNKASGLYSNHHLGGIVWLNNTSAHNRWNYNMINRKNARERVDVPGYDHLLENNLSFEPRDKDCSNIDLSTSMTINNSFGPDSIPLDANDFESTDPSTLLSARQQDGSLPEIRFMHPRHDAKPSLLRMGYTFQANPTQPFPVAKPSGLKAGD